MWSQAASAIRLPAPCSAVCWITTGRSFDPYAPRLCADADVSIGDHEVRQALKRGYADKWIGGARPVTMVGVNFNPKKRNIDIPAIGQA